MQNVFIFASTLKLLDMAVTRFYLDMRGKAKDGRGSILITIFHNHSTATIPTGIRVLPSEWNGSRITKLSGANALNAQLAKRKSEIDKAIALLALDEDFERMRASDIKAEVTGGKPKRVQGHPIADIIKEYTAHGLKEETITIYKITLKKIELFAGSYVRVEDINLKWLAAFEAFLAKTQTKNGRSIYLRALRAICNYSRNIGIVEESPFKHYPIKLEETKKRSVPVELLRTYYYYPTNKYNAYYRDYFFLMFFLIGINIKDLLTAKKSQVIDGRLEYYRAKTGKKYSIKIEPEAQALLNKYAGKDEYLVEALDHCVHYKSFLHELNNALRQIGKEKEVEIPSDDLFEPLKHQKLIEPVIPGITTYYSRHTWATLAYELGIQMDTISQALGHSFGHRTTLIYVKPDQGKVDAANRKVIDFLFEKIPGENG